jgi:hypothetical protein
VGFQKTRFTGAIESQTSKIPSSGYLAAAFGAITASAILKIVGKDDWALFVGQWPAAFLLMGGRVQNLTGFLLIPLKTPGQIDSGSAGADHHQVVMLCRTIRSVHRTYSPVEADTSEKQ